MVTEAWWLMVLRSQILTYHHNPCPSLNHLQLLSLFHNFWNIPSCATQKHDSDTLFLDMCQLLSNVELCCVWDGVKFLCCYDRPFVGQGNENKLNCTARGLREEKTNVTRTTKPITAYIHRAIWPHHCL